MVVELGPSGSQCVDPLVMILSIKPEHADRIFQGTKKYELRKTLPRSTFSRVYLYGSGGKGIIGCFDVDKVISLPKEELWNVVGEAAATRKRFEAYFSSWLIGCAIRIRDPIQFSRPLLSSDIKRSAPSFTAPLSYLLVRPGTGLYKSLEKRRKSELPGPAVDLRPISKEQHRRYCDVVTKEIAPRYDEITENFARSTLRTHLAGTDVKGIFTVKKEILSIYTESKKHIGFTTLTYKVGGAIKTGPTVLFLRYRKQGFGLSTRRAIKEYASSRGARKIYCTAPDNDSRIISYLLSSGYFIEAHLRAQYRVDGGELIFGSMLQDREEAPKLRFRADDRKSAVVEGSSVPKSVRQDIIRFQLKASGIPIDDRGVQSIALAAEGGNRRSYEDKPLSLLLLTADGDCTGLLLTIPKRGGAVKGICACSTRSADSIRALLFEGEIRARNDARRKMYFLTPVNDILMYTILNSTGYRSEGLLREPYQSGLDVFVMSKLL